MAAINNKNSEPTQKMRKLQDDIERMKRFLDSTLNNEKKPYLTPNHDGLYSAIG